MIAPWWQGASVYQVYIRSFRDSNGDGQGDLPGLATKLDYIAALGVDAVWLSPLHPSPNRDWGYDVSDYDGVQPDYGTPADFAALVEAAHARGLKVILDEVLAHTSDEHPWFAASRDGDAAKKENRFCLPFTRFLLHQPLGGVRGQASDITIEAEEILKMRARLIKEIAMETGQPYEKVVADTERNFWMGAEEAVKYGLVGKVVTHASEV